MIQFTVPGKPVPKGRPRMGRGAVYTPDPTKKYEALVAGVALVARQKARCRPFVGAVVMEVVIRPDGVDVRVDDLGHPARTSGPDVDNILKAIKDGLQGVIYANDRQVEQVVLRLDTERKQPRA